MSVFITKSDGTVDYGEFENFVSNLSSRRRARVMFELVLDFYSIFRQSQNTIGLDILFQYGVSINTRNADGETPLHLAIWLGNHDLAYWLVERGVDMEIKDNKGRTALHRAVNMGQYQTVCMLLNAGANVNATVSDTGDTPLHLALYRAMDAIVFRILEHPKCNRSVANKQGQWPIELCATERRELLRYFSIF